MKKVVLMIMIALFSNVADLAAINNGYGGLGSTKGNYSSGGANNGAQSAYRNRVIL